MRVIQLFRSKGGSSLVRVERDLRLRSIDRDWGQLKEEKIECIHETDVLHISEPLKV